MFRLFLIVSVFYLNNSIASSYSESQEESTLNRSNPILINDQEGIRKLDKRIATLYRDIDGCEDDYLKCELCMCQFGGTLSKTASKILIISSTLMTGLVAIPELLDDQTKAILISSSAIFNLTSVAFLSFKLYSDKEVEKRKAKLMDAILNNDDV